MCDLNVFELAQSLVAEMRELMEERNKFESDDLDGYYDYLGGLIDARGVIVGRLGYASLVNETDWTDC